MSSLDASRDKHPGAERRIAGPIHEFDRFDRPTGTTYYRCTRCGAEALERHHLAGCCEDA